MQAPIAPPDVRYIKLGRGGAWVDHAFTNNVLELGHKDVPEEIAASGDQQRIRQAVEAYNPKKATDFTREILAFYTLPAGALWITFARGQLWWAIAGETTRWIGETDNHGARVRELSTPWRNTDLSGAPLHVDGLSGQLTKSAAYQQSICKVEAKDYLLRRINARPSALVEEAGKVRTAFQGALQAMIRELKPDDFEMMVDLLFLRSGWQRVGGLGGTLADVDLVLVEPLSGARAFVQVKSAADAATFSDYVERYRQAKGYERMFFVCHTPHGSWPSVGPDITVLTGETLAKAVGDAGIFDWVAGRVQ